MERRVVDDQDMGDVQFNRPGNRAQMPPQGPQGPRVMRPTSFRAQQQEPQEQPPQEDEALEPRSTREMIADFLPLAVRIAGVMMVLYSGFATVLFIYQMAGQFIQNVVFQGVLGVLIAVGIFFGQAVAVSTPNKIGREVYVVLLVFDSIFTATMAHSFTLAVIDTYPWVPIALMAATSYIGFRVTQRKWTTFKVGLIAIGMAAIALVGQIFASYTGNMELLVFVLWGVDIIGAVWNSRLGEEAALGRRLAW